MRVVNTFLRILCAFVLKLYILCGNIQINKKKEGYDMIFPNDDQLKDNIQKNLIFYRKKAKVTQKDLADKLGVAATTVSTTEAVACCFSGFFAPFVYCALFMFRCCPVFKGLSQPRSEPRASSFRISCPAPWCCTFPCVLSGMPPVLLLFSYRRIHQDCFFLLRCVISERPL